jgi:hypothetical protein
MLAFPQATPDGEPHAHEQVSEGELGVACPSNASLP